MLVCLAWSIFSKLLDRFSKVLLRLKCYETTNQALNFWWIKNELLMDRQCKSCWALLKGHIMSQMYSKLKLLFIIYLFKNFISFVQISKLRWLGITNQIGMLDLKLDSGFAIWFMPDYDILSILCVQKMRFQLYIIKIIQS